jgi:hypothetical protein
MRSWRGLLGCGSGIGSVVVIEGGPGFGKTRLLRETFAAAIDLGIRGGHGMADPLDRVVELAPLFEALFQNDPPRFDRSRPRDLGCAGGSLGSTRPEPDGPH